MSSLDYATETYLEIPETSGRAHWLLGEVAEIKNNPFRLFTQSHFDLGPIYALKNRISGDRKIIVLTDPDYFQQVLQSHNKRYAKSQNMAKALHDDERRSLFSSNGTDWLARRRKMQPAFHRREINHFGKIIVDETLIQTNRWHSMSQKQGCVNMATEIKRLTMLIFGRTFFSMTFDQEIQELGDSLDIYLKSIMQRWLAPIKWPTYVPTAPNRAFKKSVNHLRTAIGKLLTQRLEGEAQRDRPTDLLDMLLDAYAEQGSISYDELIEEMLVLIIAGHETTATTISAALYLLASNPGVADKFSQELDQVLEGKPPTMEDLASLTYTRMIVSEAMRLYPAAFGMNRIVIEDDVIGEYQVHKDDSLSINLLGMHRHPDHWERPNSFYPEHFLPEVEKSRHPYAYIPFGGGPRKCIGYRFAMVESQLVLATLWQNFKFLLQENYTPDIQMDFTLYFGDGLPMRCTAMGT